jgi:hypothetical protein
MRLDNLSGSGGVYLSAASAVVANRRNNEFAVYGWHWVDGLIPEESTSGIKRKDAEVLLLLPLLPKVAKYVEYLRDCREDTRSLDSCMC